MRSTKYIVSIIALLVAGLAVSSCRASPKLPDGLYASVETVKGTITISLAYDKAPLAAANFAGLAEGLLDATAGRHFFDGLVFHRVEAGFVVQGGDPAGDGSGDPGYNFPDEFDPALRHDGPGIVAMANYGPDTNGSQFYITFAAAPALDDHYTIFGRVVQGMDVVEKLAAGDVMTKVTIIRVGSSAKAFQYDQTAWDTYYAPAVDASKARTMTKRKTTIEGLMASWPGLEARADGILTKIITPGSGPAMHRGALVQVAYKGMLPDGQVFDQSILQGKPFEFELGTGQVITGWDKIVLEMRKGEKRLVAIPPEYAYGTQGAGGIIPPNSYLIFEMELVDYKE